MVESEVQFTSLDRVIFPDAGFTKGDLVAYYRGIAPIMLPFIAGRPVSLVRCPQGQASDCFFQKHDSGIFGPFVGRVPIAEKNGEAKDYLCVNDARGILACVQMGTIEFHPWESRADDVETPDRLVFDLDPGEGCAFGELRQAASDIREQLAARGLTSFAMLTGGKGLHVIAPLARGHAWDAHRGFAKELAEGLAQAEPERFTAGARKAERKGRIFIDWLRNQRGSTAIAPYSARARPGAPVAVPVSWDELATMKRGGRYSIDDAGNLLKRHESRELAGWGEASQRLPQD